MNELRFGLILTDLCRTASFCSNMGSVGEISTANKIPNSWLDNEDWTVLVRSICL